MWGLWGRRDELGRRKGREMEEGRGEGRSAVTIPVRLCFLFFFFFSGFPNHVFGPVECFPICLLCKKLEWIWRCWVLVFFFFLSRGVWLQALLLFFCFPFMYDLTKDTRDTIYGNAAAVRRNGRAWVGLRTTGLKRSRCRGTRVQNDGGSWRAGGV